MKLNKINEILKMTLVFLNKLTNSEDNCFIRLQFSEICYVNKNRTR